MMKYLKVLLITALIGGVSPISNAQIYTTNVSSNGDAHVSEQNNSTNYGGDNSFWVRRNNGASETNRGFISFNLNTIPTDAIITEAYLKVYANSVIGTSNLDLYVERCDSTWHEDTVTWDNQPGSYISDQVSVSNSVSSLSGWQEFDVSDHVQEFMNAPWYNLGWRIRLQNEGVSADYGIKYASAESGSNQPVLEVKYILPAQLSTSVTHSTNGNDDGQLLVNVSGGNTFSESNMRIHKVVRSTSQLGAASLSNVTNAVNLIYDSNAGTITANNIEPGVYRLRIYDDLYYSNGNDPRFRFYKYFLVGEEGATTSGILLPSVSYQENVRVVRDKSTSSNPTDLENQNQSYYTNLYVSSEYIDQLEYASFIQYYMDFDPQLEFTKADLTLKAANIFYNGPNSSNETKFSLVTSPWNEKTVTWNTRPSVTTDPGLIMTLPETVEGYDSLDYFDSISILPFVQFWQQNPSLNYGFEMALTDYNYTSWASRNYKGSSSNQNFIEFEFKVKNEEVYSKSFNASQDASVNSLSPTTNNGGSDKMEIKANGAIGEAEQSLIEFDITSIPEGAIITDATLKLYASNVTGSTNLDLYLDRNDGDWDESTVDWNTKPAQFGTDKINIPNATSSVQGVQEYDVEDHVQHFLRYEHLNAGWNIRLIDETQGSAYGIEYFTSEHANDILRPKLNVNYILPIEFEFDITHCTPGNSDASVDATISGGSGEYDYYWWVSIADVTGGHANVQHGAFVDQNSIDVTGLAPGLYVLKIRDKEWVADNDDKYIFTKMVLIGREGETTVFSVSPNENYSSDAIISTQKDPAGDDWDNENDPNNIYFASTFVPTTSGGAKYDNKSLIQWPIEFDDNLVFEEADLYLQTQYGHFRYNTASNESWISRVTEPWQEDVITWNIQPSTTTENRVSLPETGATGYTYEEYHVDVLHFINYWQDNPTENHGLELSLKDFDMTSSARLGFSSSAVPSKKPQLILTYRVKGPVETSFDETTGLGTIEIQAPETGQLPYKYLISYEPLPILDSIWNDTIGIDSLTFFQGDVPSTNFTFSDLPSERYFVGVYDNTGTKIADLNAPLTSPFEFIDQEGLEFDGNNIVVSTGQPSGKGTIDGVLYSNMSGGIDFNVDVYDNMAIGFNRLNDLQAATSFDLEYNILFSDRRTYTVAKGNESLFSETYAIGDNFRWVKENYEIVLYRNEFEVFRTEIEEDLLDDYKIDVLLFGSNAKFGEAIKIGKYSKYIVRPVQLQVTNTECDLNNGSIRFISAGSFFYSSWTTTINVVDLNSGATVIADYVYTGPSYITFLLPVGEYQVFYSSTNGSSTMNWSEIFTIGQPIEWNLIDPYYTAVSGTVNTITTNTYMSNATAISQNVLLNGDDGWLQFHAQNKKVYVPFGAPVMIMPLSFSAVSMIDETNQDQVRVRLTSWFPNILNKYVQVYDDSGTPVGSSFSSYSTGPFRIDVTSGSYNTFDVYFQQATSPFATTTAASGDDMRAKALSFSSTVFNTYSSFCYGLTTSDVCAHLDYELDGNYYVTNNGKFCFVYNEEYNDENIEFNIYNNAGYLVADQNDFTVPALIHGENRVVLDLTTNGYCLAKGFYILEVINDKKEKFYLRVYNNHHCASLPWDSIEEEDVSAP